MHVRFSNRAEADLDQLQAYLEPRNPRAFDRVMSAILTASDQLGAFPFLGREGRVEETRELSVPRTPYFIVYHLPDAYHVDILRIMHERRQYPEDA